MLVNQKKHRSKKRLVLALALSFIIVFSIPSAVLLTPRPAYAQWTTFTIGDIPAMINRVKDWVWNAIKKAANVAFNMNYSRYLNRMAYDYAVKLTTIGPGGKPLVFSDPWGPFLQAAKEEAAGKFLDSVSKEFFGKTLCEPLDPLIKLKLIVELEKAEVPRRATCTFSDIVGNIKNTEIISGTGLKLGQLNSKMNPETFGKFMVSWFNPQVNPLGNFIILKEGINKEKEEKAKEKEKEREVAGADQLQGVKTTISGQTKTPPGFVADQQKEATKEAQKKEQENAQKLVEKHGPIGQALSVFANTFAIRYMKLLLNKGLFALFKQSEPGGGVGGRGGTRSLTVNVREASREYFSGFITPPFRSGGITDVTASLASCPSDSRQRAFNNCIIDSDFLSAITRKMTVQEAIDEGLLDPNKTFGFNSDGSEPSYTDGYPYKSLVVLRKYRIIPVTWELAALYIRDVSQLSRTYSLGDILRDFDNPESPFYHLVDPNWVLKVPVFECRFEGPGPQKLQDDIEVVDTGQTNPDTGERIMEEIAIIARASYCADDRSCIEESPTGQCRKFGYCTKERDIWRFQGDQCEPEFATCRTLTTADGKPVSYLTNTLERCDSSQVGCQFYSAYKTLNGEWAEDIWDEETDSSDSDGRLTFADIANRSDLGDISYGRYFNNQVENCSSVEEGCNRFLEFTNFYSAPPGFEQTTESIYAYVQSTTTEDYARWGEIREVYMKKPPPNIYCPTDISDPARDPACDNYLQWCEPDEVGCSLYIPVNGDPPIPAVLSPGDYCNVECIGYDQYLELPTNFDSSSRQVDLIPETATSCRVEEVGCERFTNLDEVAQGGEGIEYFSFIRECILPDDPAAKIFYTWEGSDTTGYQLKTWRLKSEPDGSPSGDSCVLSQDNLDCRQFIDANGNTYPRLLSTVVFATDDCHPYRREVDGTVMNGIKSLSTSCSAAAVGCREYRGNSGNVVKIIISDDFENATTSGWVGGILSQESVYVGGHSLDKDGNVHKEVSGLLETGKSYTLSFWAKGKANGVLQVSLENSNGRSVANITVDTEWNYYQIGPLYIHFGIDDTTQEYFYFRGGVGAYLDNIILREISDSYYLIKDSWQTPGICDQPYAGAQLGCDAYRNQGGGEIALLGFSKLCSDDKVGCKVMIDTQNSTSPYQEEFNTDNDNPDNPESYYDNVVVPADKLVYVVDNSNNYCSSQAVGCRLMGRAIEDRQTGEIKQFSDEFVIDNPDKYSAGGGGILCSLEGLYCQEYHLQDSGTVAYYIDPAERVCEYKTDLTTGQADWYKKGTDELCETNKVCSNDLAIYCTEDSDCDFSASGGTAGICIDKIPEQPLSYNNPLYDGWVGLCSQDQNSCSQYIDPEGEKYCTNNQATSCQQDADCIDILDRYSGTSSGLCRPHLTKQSYYYRENSVDTASCNGIVDRAAGCRLFNKTDGYPAAYTRDAYSSSLSSDGSAPQSDPSFVYRNGREDYFNNDANVLIKVDKDRVCDQWLYCRTKIEGVDDQGNKVDRCFAIGLCDGLNDNNQCSSFPSVKKACSISGTACNSDFDCEGGDGDVCQVLEITGEQNRDINASSTWSYDPSRYSVEDLRMMSGYVKAGMRWTGFGQIRDGVVYGYYPYSKMYEVGGIAEIVNGNFEEVNRDESGQNSGVRVENYPFLGWRSDRGGNCLQSGGSSVCEITEDSNAKVSGKYSAKLSVSPGSQGADLSNIRLVQDLRLPVGEYVLSGYMRWAGVQGSGTGEQRPRVNVEVFWNNNTESTSLGGMIGGSQGWERFSLPFQNTAEDVNIRLILWQVETGTAWFDDIKIEPVLKVADTPEDVLISQSCRMYPKGDSPACEYEKGSKSYRGWRGYCVEPDPNNANYCVNWWPVDLIRGSSTEVGEEPLTFNERTPLYYCLNSTGFRSRDDSELVPQDASNGDSEFLPAWNDYTIALLPSYHCTTNCDEDDIFEPLRPGLSLSTSHGPVWASVSSRGIISDITYNDVEFFEIQVTNQTGQTWNGTYYVKAEDYYYDHDTLNAPTWSKRYTSSGNCQGIAWNCEERILENEDRLDLRAVWNQDGTFNRFMVGVFDPSPVDGGGVFRIYIHLREACQYIAKVSDVVGNSIETYPYFTRVSDSSSYRLSVLNYGYSTDESPFGSAVVSKIIQRTPDPVDWDADEGDGRNGNQPLYIRAENATTLSENPFNPGPNTRGGTPYSCDGDCDVSICKGGSEHGNECSDINEAAQCYIGDGATSYGVCNGSNQDEVSNANGHDVNFGINQLSELFVKSLGVWRWEYSGGRWHYEPVPGLNWDYIASSGTPPVVDNVRVNDKTGDIIITNGGGNIKLTFTSDANNNQLPLRRYEVDWGDSSENTIYQGSFNERPSPGDPHVVFHTYQYESGASQPCRSLNVGLEEGNCSVFHINIEVEDNWRLVGTSSYGDRIIVQQ